MRRSGLATLLTAVLALGAGRPADAQPRGAGPPAAAPGPGATRREELKRQIRTMRAYELTTALGLDEATATRLFPVFARFDDETDKLVEKRVDLQRRLNQIDGQGDPRAVDRLIDEGMMMAVSQCRAARDFDGVKCMKEAHTAAQARACRKPWTK